MILGLHGRKASSVCQPTTATYSAASSYTTRASAQQKGASCVEENTHSQNTKQNPTEYHLSGAQEEEVDGYHGKMSGGGAGSIETCRDTDLITSRKLPNTDLMHTSPSTPAVAATFSSWNRFLTYLRIQLYLCMLAEMMNTDKACLNMYEALGRICILREIKFGWIYEKQAHPRLKQ